MKKRITSLLLAFLMVISLAPTALAAEGEPPYSLKYLDGIEGTKYMQYMTGEDFTGSSGALVTQYTGEFYDVKDLWNSVDGDWSKIIAPFRQRFTSAGFAETPSTDSNGEAIYIYEDGSGHRFIIDGWTTAKSYLTAGAAVLVEHLYSEGYKSQQNTGTTTQPAADGAPYSLKYLEGIAGTNYLEYLPMDDTVNSHGVTITKRTMEFYGVSDLSSSVNGDWAKIVAPFRQRFVDAGFEERAEQYNGEMEYYYEDGSGHRFVICSKTISQSYMESGSGVAIDHMYAEELKSQPATGTTTQPTAEDGSYSQKYLKNIQGINLLDTEEYEDDVTDNGLPITQYTLDIYGVSELSDSVGGDWEKIIAPVRKAFTDAGFEEWSTESTYAANDTYYFFDDGHGERFLLLGKSEAQSYMGSGVGLCIGHLRSLGFGALENFKKTQTYTSGQFADVPDSKWYAKTVQTAFELGLVKGSGDGFAPDNNMTVAEALALACRINDIYYGGKGEFTQGKPWYQVYVDYAIENGIITENSFVDYTAPINREEFAFVMYYALPDCALKAINSVAIGNISDGGSIQDACVTPVLSLYNAGILTGGSDGAFNPLNNIKRSEVATIVARMAIESERVSLG